MGWRTALAHFCVMLNLPKRHRPTMQTPSAYDQTGYLAGNQHSYGALHRQSIELVERMARVSGAKDELMAMAKICSSLARKAEDARLKDLGCFEE
jgi:hypothetical protein